MHKSLIYLAIIGMLANCHNTMPKKDEIWVEKTVHTTHHQLMTYATTNKQPYLIVFEAGLGSGHSVWQQQNLLEQVNNLGDIVLYDRAGYEKSQLLETSPERNVENMRKDLEKVIDTYAEGRKVILVGHSLGGFIIRDYAIQHPQKVAAMLFVDTSHEDFLALTQEQEDGMVADFTKKAGELAGVTKEAKMLVEDIAYMKTLPTLPNIPICAITGLKSEAPFDATAKQALFDKHQKLRKGVNDFVHIASTVSGHYVMQDDPQLIVHGLQLLASKLK